MANREMNQFSEDKIDPNSLRKEVSLSIIDGQMTNNLAIYLMRIHDIVRKKHEFFRQCS